MDAERFGLPTAQDLDAVAADPLSSFTTVTNFPCGTTAPGTTILTTTFSPGQPDILGTLPPKPLPLPAHYDLVALARDFAQRHGLAPALVSAVCEQESSWNLWAVRPEPGFFAKYIHPANPQKPTTEELLESWSFGLMQIMGAVARERGFKGKFLSELLDPATNLDIGCTHMAAYLSAAGNDTHAALQHWNGGGDPGYADRVLARMEKYS